MTRSSDYFIQLLREMQRPLGAENDIEYVMTDDLGEHWVLWIERTEKDGGPSAIWFYIDEISNRIVVESIGATRT